MRKSFFICLMMLLVAPIAIEAKKKSFGYGLYWELTKQGELIISGNGAIPNYSSPHYKKFKTNGTAPWNQKKVWDKATRVVIQEGITEIGDNAFNGRTYYRKHASTNIRDIRVPSSVTKIGKNAFAYSAISSFQFPQNTKTVGEQIFNGCRYLTSFSIPSNWGKVTGGLFYGCSNLSQVTIPEGVTEIASEAFRGCRKLQSVTLPKSLKKIGSHAFYGSGLQNLNLPDNVEEIGKSAFYDCDGLTNIQFSSKLKSIGDYAFSDCDKITTIKLPSKLETIGERAFDYCGNLQHVSTGEGVKKIGESAFYRCKKLLDVNISQNAIVGKYLFGSRSYGSYDWRFEGIIYCLPSSITESNCRYDYGIETSAFKKYKNGENGIVNSQGKMILEAKSGRKAEKKTDDHDNSIYYEITDGNGRGIMADNGKWIVPVVDGRRIVRQHKAKDKPVYYEITDKSGKGFMNENGQWIISTERGYNSISEITNGGKTYYKVGKSSYSGPYGLLGSNGRVIIPVEYPVLDAAGGKYLRFKVGDFYGIMNYQGNVVIPTTKGYTSIGNYVSGQNSFTYATYGYKGEVDANGVELSRIKVEVPKQQTVVQKEEKKTEKQETEKKIVIEHKRDPVPVQVWRQCTGCYGSGMCQSGCGGTGWFTGWSGNSTRCIGCGGSGKCQFCAGTGGHYEVEYR